MSGTFVVRIIACQPFARTKLGNRRFSIAAPHTWNDLPLDCRTIDSFTVFKSRLKTHLFCRSFVSLFNRDLAPLITVFYN
jgi:hypothetical protein